MRDDVHSLAYNWNILRNLCGMSPEYRDILFRELNEKVILPFYGTSHHTRGLQTMNGGDDERRSVVDGAIETILSVVFEGSKYFKKENREAGNTRTLRNSPYGTIFYTLLRFVYDSSVSSHCDVKNRIEKWVQAKYDQLFCNHSGVANEDERSVTLQILHDDLQLRSELGLPMSDNFEQFSQLLLSGNLVNDQLENYISCIQYYHLPTDISTSSFLVIDFFLKLVEVGQMAIDSQTSIAIARYFDRFQHQLPDMPDQVWSRILHFFEGQTRQFIRDMSHFEKRMQRCPRRRRRPRGMFSVVIPYCIRVSKFRQLSEWTHQLVDSSAQATKPFVYISYSVLDSAVYEDIEHDFKLSKWFIDMAYEYLMTNFLTQLVEFASQTAICFELLYKGLEQEDRNEIRSYILDHPIYKIRSIPNRHKYVPPRNISFVGRIISLLRKQHRLDKLMLPRKSLAKYIADMINSLRVHKVDNYGFRTENLAVFLKAMCELLEEMLVKDDEESRIEFISFVDWNYVNKLSENSSVQGDIGLFYLSLARINLSLRPYIDVGYRSEANRPRREFMSFVERRFKTELPSSDLRFQQCHEEP